MQPGAVQALPDVDVAQARERALVHQCFLERATGRAEHAVQAPDVDAPQRVGAQRGERRQLAQPVHRPAHEAAEEARVAVVDGVAVVQLEGGPHVRGRCVAAEAPDPLAGHAQVGHQTLAAIEAEQHPLAVPLDFLQPVPGQPGESLGRLAANDPRLGRPGPLDQAALGPGAELTGSDLDLGKLGHDRSLPGEGRLRNRHRGMRA